MSKKFTIFGNPVKHSISPKMHTFAIEALGCDASYEKTHLEDGSKLKEIFLKDFDGANVTVPHKEVAYRLCDEVRGEAKKIGAVNTLINENGKMIGYNTDAEGFYRSMLEFKDIKKVLIIGAGGTSKAISHILKSKGFDVSILNRSKERLADFSEFKTMSWDSFKDSDFDIIINTTSAGLEDDTPPAPKDIMHSLFSDANYAIDVIYNKKTPFLTLAKDYNLKTKDGADMLLYQGVLAFELFYENEFSFEQILPFMKRAFA
jgi:shikimate dehydrogenase